MSLQSPTPQYLPHIDGIRTIAVVSVMLFHIFGYLCPGGYIGVDIFFVISGYLITKGILNELKEGKFTIKHFYEKRIRRIIPAYLALIIIVLLVSSLIYGGNRLNSIYEAAQASCLFGTNIYFYLNSGYFDLTAENNPLLQLWSLGVEEQFYVIIPLLFIILYRHIPNRLFSIILFLTIISLTYSLYQNTTDNQTSNFYLLPTRAWELLAGSLLSIISRKTTDKSLPSWPSYIGLALCLAPCWLYHKSTLFPGITAIPPVLGAALLIRYAQTGIVGMMLQSKPFSFIGKISYSLYLWHWPLIVFWRYLSNDSTSPYALWTIFFSSFLLAWASWKWIETPFRKSTYWNFKRCTILTGASCLILGLGAFSLANVPSLNHWVKGKSILATEERWHGNSPQRPDFLDPHFPDDDDHSSDSFQVLGQDSNPQYILWGDSHAGAIAAGFNYFSQKSGINGLYVCRKNIPGKDIWTQYHQTNTESVESVLSWLKNNPNIKWVIIANHWERRFSNNAYPIYSRQISSSNPYEILKDGLERLCQEIQNMGKNVIICPLVPIQSFDVQDVWVKSQIINTPMPLGINKMNYTEQASSSNKLFTYLEQKGLAKRFMYQDFFFNHDGMGKLVSVNNQLRYTDSNHISTSCAIELIECHYKTLLHLFHYTDPID